MNIKQNLRAVSRQLGKHTVFLVAIAMAAVVGGASTAFVMAAIPSSDGTIHACYDKTGGKLNVIDSEAGKTCTNKQNPISWSQNGGGTAEVIHDANGQVLGDLVDATSPTNLQVYNHTVNRLIPIKTDGVSPTFTAGTGMTPVFESDDCSGQALVVDLDSNSPLPFKTSLFSFDNGTTTTYYIVADNAVGSTNVTVNSMLGSGGVSCTAIPDTLTADAYPITSVPAPFTAPLATPFKF